MSRRGARRARGRFDVQVARRPGGTVFEAADQKAIWSAQVTETKEEEEVGMTEGERSSEEESEGREEKRGKDDEKGTDKKETDEEGKRKRKEELQETGKKKRKRKRRRIPVTVEDMQQAQEEIDEQVAGAKGTREQKEMKKRLWEESMQECGVQEPYKFSVPAFKKVCGVDVGYVNVRL